MLKILHAADLHLDSPFAALDERRAEIRRGELRAAFLSLVTYAQKNGIDLLLLAGDLFDTEFVTRETVSVLRDGFSRLSCPVVIAPGNHDCAAPGSVWQRERFGENVHVFLSPSLEKFSFDELGADVYGYAFTAPELMVCPLDGHTVDDPSRINLLCAHGDLGAPVSRYAPLPRAALAAFGADYAALGHVHNPAPIELRDGTVVAYAGCLEGRAPDETGPKGAVLCEIEKADGRADVHAVRLRFSRRRYETLEADVGGAQSMLEIHDRLAAAVREAGWGEDTLGRATLRGALPPSLVIDTAALEAQFPQLFSMRVTDETAPLLDGEDFKNDRTARGVFYRALAEKMESGSPRERRIAALALRYGLSAIAGENISDY